MYSTDRDGDSPKYSSDYRLELYTSEAVGLLPSTVMAKVLAGPPAPMYTMPELSTASEKAELKP